MQRFAALLLALVCAVASFNPMLAGNGPFSIGRRLHHDSSGIWTRSNQKPLMDATIVTVIGTSPVLCNQSKPGDTVWRSVDAMVVSSLATEALKFVFQCERPLQTSDPSRGAS